MGLDRFGIAEFVPCFLAGVIAYYLLCRRKKQELPFWIWGASLCTISWIYLKWNAGVESVGFPEWVCCLGIGLVFVYCTESKHRVLNYLTHHVAKYSYGLYLGQVPVLWLAFVKLNYLPLSLQWSLFFLLIIAVPLVSYHLIEHPFIKLGMVASASKRLPQKSDRSGVSATKTP
jgi:peptidoglycan/LPS O-acetylase OafA/YrhL